jgi:hypothetical protein
MFIFKVSVIFSGQVCIYDRGLSGGKPMVIFHLKYDLVCHYGFLSTISQLDMICSIYPMFWYHKEYQTRFDMLPPEGTFFLIGDLHPQLGKWVEGTKYPALFFPSGLAFELWEASPAPDDVMIHLGGELDDPLYADRDAAHEMIDMFYLPRNFVAIQINDNGIDVFGLLPYVGYRLTYDNKHG